MTWADARGLCARAPWGREACRQQSTIGLRAPVRGRNCPCCLVEVIRKKANIRKRLHDARHTAASHLLAAGVDVRTASTILGHANPSITLSIYSHQMAGLTENAIDKLDGRLRAAIEHRRENET